MALGFTAAFGVGAIVAKGAIDAASNLNETVSKTRAVFGDASVGIEQWAKGAAKGIGQSRQEALDAASTFGNLFVQLGVGVDQAGGLSTQMVELASDFASFHNAAPTSVIEAMTAAFRGEYDAVQRYVPTITAASVEQRALELTGKKLTKELTAQDKALAVQKLLFEGAGNAVGDFARTSDGAANRQRILAAQVKDLQAQLGQKLLPVFQALLGFIVNDLIPGIAAFTGWLKEHREVALILAGVIGGAVVAAFIAWAASIYVTIAALSPIILIIGAVVVGIAALAAGIIYAYTHFAWFRTTVDTVWEILKTTFNWVADNWPLLLAILTGPIGLAALEIIKHWGAIKNGFTAVKDWIADRVEDIGGVFSGLWLTAIRVFGDIRTFVEGIWDGLATGFKGVVNTLLGTLETLLNEAGGAVNSTFIRAVNILNPFKDVPKVPEVKLPRLHQGGEFRAPTPGGEGLAILRDRERVVPAGATGARYEVNLYGADITAEDMVRALRRHELTNAFLAGMP